MDCFFNQDCIAVLHTLTTHITIMLLNTYQNDFENFPHENTTSMQTPDGVTGGTMGTTTSTMHVFDILYVLIPAFGLPGLFILILDLHINHKRDINCITRIRVTHMSNGLSPILFALQLKVLCLCINYYHCI